MRSVVVISVVGFLVGCAATPRTQPRESISNPSIASVSAPAADPESVASFDFLPPASTSSLPASLLTPAVGPMNLDNYVTAKGGVFYPSEGDIDPGVIVNLAIGHYFTRNFSLELEGGYTAPDVERTQSTDFYAIPLMVNGRVNVPVGILEAYGGAGLGATYYELEIGALDEDEWLFTGSVFVGADISVFERLTAGLEVKYYIVEEFQHSNDSLDAFAVMATLGWRF